MSVDVVSHLFFGLSFVVVWLPYMLFSFFVSINIYSLLFIKKAFSISS